MKIQETFDINQKIETSDSGILSMGSSMFQRLGEEFFGFKSEIDGDLDLFIKQFHKYNLHSLPIELNEFFLEYRAPQFSFLKEYYLLNDMAKKSNEKRKLTFGSKQLEDFFIQWTTSKNPEGKLYYAKSLISKIKDDHSKLINMLILAFIFSYEESLTDYNAASNLFERAENLFINFNSNSRIRDRILYIINIFSGFTELKRYCLDEAYAKFQNAMQYNNWSVNAKFYSALTEIRMDNPDEALNSLMEVIEYDEMRLKFAITSNNYLLFKYFLNNNYIEKIFFYDDFSILFDVLQQLTSEKLNRGIASINDIISKTEGLNNKKSFKYLKEANRKDLIFIEKLIKDYKDSQNYYVHSSILIIEKKLNNIIESIIKNIKDQNNIKLELHENLYDEKISSESNKIKDLEDELSFDQKELELEFNSRKKAIDSEVAQKVRELEFQLESLESSKNTMSLKAFSNSMFYNIFISIFVALTGGFAEYTNSSQSSINNFGGIMIVIIIHGMKWGLLSFIIGLVVSAFTSVSTVISIYSKKQRISKMINDTNSYKQRIIDALSSDLETRKQRLISNANVLLNNHKKNLERLGIEKEKKMSSLKIEIDETIEKEVAPFILLID